MATDAEIEGGTFLSEGVALEGILMLPARKGRLCGVLSACCFCNFAGVLLRPLATRGFAVEVVRFTEMGDFGLGVLLTIAAGICSFFGVANFFGVRFSDESSATCCGGSNRSCDCRVDLVEDGQEPFTL